MDTPPIVSPQEWLAARKELLAKEKELTRMRNRVNADRRLPMVRIDKPYTVEGPNGTVGLLDLFEGRQQLDGRFQQPEATRALSRTPVSLTLTSRLRMTRATERSRRCQN